MAQQKKPCFPKAESDQFSLAASLTQSACMLMASKQLSKEEATKEVISIYREALSRLQEIEAAERPQNKASSIRY